MCFHKVGFEADRFSIATLGFAQASETIESVAKITVRFGKVGFEKDRRPITRFRFCEPSKDCEGIDKIAVRLGKVGLNPYGLLKILQSRLPVSSVY